MICGVAESEIEEKAKLGESWEEAAQPIKAAKERTKK
jgi:hypothetical protein